MLYSKSLRAIGLSLETLGLKEFVIEKRGQNYVVRSDLLSPGSKSSAKKNILEKTWNLGDPDRKGFLLPQGDDWLLYKPPYVSWLDAQGRRKRRRRFSAQARGSKKLSQLLRTVGKHLDRLDTNSFRISWTPHSIVVEYELAGGELLQENLNVKKLHELDLRMRFRRAPRR